MGIETHLVTDGAALYQIPMTYRGAPLPGGAPALIATAEHSVLGTCWIYDAEADPVWVGQVLQLMWTNGVSDPSGKRGVGPAQARGHRMAPERPPDDLVRLELTRVVTPTGPAADPTIVGLVMGTWHPDGPDTAAASGCLAVARTAGG